MYFVYDSLYFSPLESKYVGFTDVAIVCTALSLRCGAVSVSNYDFSKKKKKWSRCASTFTGQPFPTRSLSLSPSIDPRPSCTWCKSPVIILKLHLPLNVIIVSNKCRNSLQNNNHKVIYTLAHEIVDFPPKLSVFGLEFMCEELIRTLAKSCLKLMLKLVPHTKTPSLAIQHGENVNQLSFAW